ncbi:MAG: DUF6452 family protein [Muribaculaceae bacterium]
MGKLLRNIFFALCGVAIVVSCNTNGCLDNQSSIPLAGFYAMDTKKAITIDSISVYGIGVPNDSMILRNAKGIKQVYLPFRLNANVTEYVIHYDQKTLADIRNNDTLTFKYKSIPYFVSNECGAMYQYEIEDFAYTRHLIDSLGLVSKKITNVNVESMKIYMRTKTKPTK